MLCQLSYTRLLRLDRVAQLAERWTSIPKVAGSIPTVVRQTFQPARCGYTLRVTSKTLYSPEYITPKHTQKYHANNLFDLISIAFGTCKVSMLGIVLVLLSTDASCHNKKKPNLVKCYTFGFSRYLKMQPGIPRQEIYEILQ